MSTKLMKISPAHIVCIMAIAVFALVLAARMTDKLPAPTVTKQSASMKTTETYRSERLNFSIQRPSSYTPSEDSLSVILTRDTQYVHITRNGSNDMQLKTYINSLMKKNNFKLDNQKRLTIHGLDALTGTVDYMNGEKQTRLIYFIYADGWIYTLFTDDQSAYADLEGIAQSFRYTP